MQQKIGFIDVYESIQKSAKFKKYEAVDGILFISNLAGRIERQTIVVNFLKIEIVAIKLTNEYMQLIFQTVEGDSFINVLYSGITTFEIKTEQPVEITVKS